MDGGVLALLGVAAIAGAGSLAQRHGSSSLAERYQVRRRRRGDYVIVDVVTGDSSSKYGETWKRKVEAERVVARLLSVFKERVAA